tara:strand:+ start:6653 stop:6892 length:240 start_codon:yes stop_codon:yes gene_type:complete
MSFEVRSQLLKLVQNDIASYEMAFDFIQDDANKLEIFREALHGQSVPEGLIEARTAGAVMHAMKLWNVMYPTEVKPAKE